MLIVCPSCGTSYEVAPDAMGPGGRSVRCVRCRNVWFAANTSALNAIAQAHRADVEAMVGARAAASAAPSPSPSSQSIPDLPSHDNPPRSSASANSEPAWSGSAPPPLARDVFEDDIDGPPAPVRVVDAPGLAPLEHEPAPPAARADIESVAARRGPKQRAGGGRLTPNLLTLVLLLGVTLAVLLAWRTDVVRLLPQTAGLYRAIGLPVNLRGLVFDGVRTARETHDGVPVLVVEGNITSAASRTVEVPRLRFALRNKAGQEIYSWTALPARNVLRPGETLEFRSLLASPPRNGEEVLVRFFNRRDLMTGIQ